MLFYDVPLEYKMGEFTIEKTDSIDADDFLELEYDEKYKTLSYDEPKSENTVNIYSVPHEAVKDTKAVYDDRGKLSRITLTHDGRERLIYIRYGKMMDSKVSVLEFLRNREEKILSEITKRGGMFARLFIESFYDGDAVDIAVKTATPEEMQAVIDENGGDVESADYSGEYPVENRIELDNETLRIMLLCTNGKYRDKLFAACVDEIADYIKKHVLDSINKTDNFRFICEAYD